MSQLRISQQGAASVSPTSSELCHELLLELHILFASVQSICEAALVEGAVLPLHRHRVHGIRGRPGSAMLVLVHYCFARLCHGVLFWSVDLRVCTTRQEEKVSRA